MRKKKHCILYLVSEMHRLSSDETLRTPVLGMATSQNVYETCKGYNSRHYCIFSQSIINFVHLPNTSVLSINNYHFHNIEKHDIVYPKQRILRVVLRRLNAANVKGYCFLETSLHLPLLKVFNKILLFTCCDL